VIPRDRKKGKVRRDSSRSPSYPRGESCDDELGELLDIGIGLMAEHDRDALLHKILVLGKQVTESDAGILVLAEPDGQGGQRMRPLLYEIDSLNVTPELAERSYAVDDSTIAGYAAVNRKLMVIDDARELMEEKDAFPVTRELEQRYRYHRRSMLIVPMVDHVDCLVGVLMFINRKTDPTAKIDSEEAVARWVIPYTDREMRVAHSLASHAAISIENAELYARLERMLERVVKAAVTAVDQRDPTTAGHSLRVAALAMELASAVNRATDGPFATHHFTREQLRELYFSTLLHDFGKVTVSDHVLMKSKKLPPVLWERIDARFDLIRRTLELEHCRARAVSNGDGDALDRKLAADVAELDDLRRVVHDANQPNLLPRTPNPTLYTMTERTFVRPDGTHTPYLTPQELHYLLVPYGSLDERERAEIQSHVDESYRFLADIPWTDDLKNLPAYAYGHHEKLNGTGYPRRLRDKEIPLQTRIMTIADMFDALTESDRPYKAAVSADQALEILQADAREGLLDPDLVQLLVDTQAYRKILEEDWHRF
jgi:HD-GYP domain-containing protein (c-di-GMP phosphodiesterase class II)